MRGNIAIWQVSAVLLLAALGACSGKINEEPEQKTSSASSLTGSSGTQPAIVADTVHMIVKTGVSTTFYVKTLPKATCALHGKDVLNALSLYADDNGFISLHPTTSADGVQMVTLDCVGEGGATLTHQVELASTSSASALASAHVSAITAPPPVVGTVRPALQGDPMSYSFDYLHTHGYGSRPDKDRESARYKAWARAVAQPSTLVPDRRVTIPKRNVPSGIWAGWLDTLTAAQSKAGVIFNEVGGSWWQPSAYYDANGGSNIGLASFWVGLDNGPDVWQAGTEADTYSTCWCGDNCGCTEWGSNNYAWVEFFPDNPVTVPNFNVNPANGVEVWVWVCDSQGNLAQTLSDAQFGCVWMHNWANGADYSPGGFSNNVWINITGRGFNGTNAEAIVEKQPNYDLTRFGSWEVTNPAVCFSSSYECLPPWDVNGAPLTMTNGGTTLAVPSILNNTDLLVNWGWYK